MRRREPVLGLAPLLTGLASLTLLSAALRPVAEVVGLLGGWPWIPILALLLALPFRSRADSGPCWFTPVTFPVWTYLAPVFVVGSVLLLTGLAHHPMQPGLVAEPVGRFYFLALGYLSIGWGALLLGFYSHLGAAAGEAVERRLPRLAWTAEESRWPAAILLAVGIALSWLAFQRGLIGAQRTAIPGRFDALLIYASWLGQLAAFWLWFSLFERSWWRVRDRLLAAALTLLGPIYMVVTASRAALFSYLLLVACAWGLAGRRVTWRSAGAFVCLTGLSLALGITWSTTYRMVKGNENLLGLPATLDAPLVGTAFGDRREPTSARARHSSRNKTLHPQLSSVQEANGPFRPEGRRATSEAERMERTRSPGADADPLGQETRRPRETREGTATAADGADRRRPAGGRPLREATPNSEPRPSALPERPGLLREFYELVGETVRAATQRDVRETVSFVLLHLGQRIEITSSLAVVVSNYERLRGAEEEAGIAHNIWRDTLTSLVPRALWPAKPKVADARTYSRVYFNYGESSFAMTPVGDLLRNFGPLGIALGMALLGVALRLLFRVLIEAQEVLPSRAGLYVAVLTTVSYEGFFSGLLPVAMRMAVITMGGVLFVHLQVSLVRWRRRTPQMSD